MLTELVKSGFASKRSYSPVTRNGSVNDSEAKIVEFLPAKKCSGKSVFYLVLDVNISAKDLSRKTALQKFVF